jgi:hypothetical protein
MVLAYISIQSLMELDYLLIQLLLVCIQLSYFMHHIINSFCVQQTRFIIRVDSKYK